MKKILARIFAKYKLRKPQAYILNPLKTQNDIFCYLIRKGEKTAFGQDHNFESIKNYEDFKSHVPIRTYEDIYPYIKRAVDGEKNVLWSGRPKYFAKTSGTTSGAKYIPLSKESLKHQIDATLHMLLRYIIQTGNTSYVGGKMIFLQGSPKLDKVNGIPTGRLSGIVAHHVPPYLQSNRKPSYSTNCIEDWERKVEAVVNETISADMTLISGIPSWLQMYFEKLSDRSGKNIGELFPNLSLMVTGGVNFEPYRARFEQLIGRKIDILETYPASEGFIAASDSEVSDGSLLLMVGSGIFYEFIPAEEFYSANPTRLSLQEVQIGKNYALVLSTDAGLWAYAIGDTVEFTSTSPYRIKVTGRVAHYTSAFGEHVIVKEVEHAISEACRLSGASVTEFTVAPQINPEQGLPYHQWFVEFNTQPDDLNEFATTVDRLMCEQNIYYRDLVEGKILRTLIICSLEKDAFNSHMKSIGRLGGQNKIPRLANDRKNADNLSKYIISQNN